MNIAQHILIASIRLYKAVLSPLQSMVFGPGAGCRYSPTCSSYAKEAVQRHGALKGTFLAATRLGRCHPWGGCGDDPVPEHYSFFRRSTESPHNFHFCRHPRFRA